MSEASHRTHIEPAPSHSLPLGSVIALVVLALGVGMATGWVVFSQLPAEATGARADAEAACQIVDEEFVDGVVPERLGLDEAPVWRLQSAALLASAAYRGDPALVAFEDVSSALLSAVQRLDVEALGVALDELAAACSTL